jgi:hypothetical protein
VRVVPEATGGVTVIAREWPLAGPVGAVLLCLGLPLLGWSIADGHPVEGGGAVVFVGLGAFAAYLGCRNRRTISLVRESDSVQASGVEGAGPWRRQVHVRLSSSATPRVDELCDGGSGAAAVAASPSPVPAHDRPSDRGADLVLGDGATTIRLARGIGPGGRTQVAAAADAILRML